VTTKPYVRPSVSVLFLPLCLTTRIYEFYEELFLSKQAIHSTHFA